MAAVRASGPGKEPGESDTGDDILLLDFIGRPVTFKDNSVPGTCTELYTGRARLFGMTVKRVKGKKRSEWDMLGSYTGRDVVRIIRDPRQVVSITMHDRKKGTMVLNVPLLPSTNIAVAADFAKSKRENIRAWVFDAYDFSGGDRQMRHFALRFTRDRVRDPNDPTGKKAVQLETSKYAQRFEYAFNAQKRHMEELAPGLLEQAKQAAASGVDGETGFALNPGLEGIMETRTHITEVSEEEETDAYESERRLKRAQLLQEATARSTAAASPAQARAQAGDAGARMKLEQQYPAQNTQQATNGVQGTPVRAAAGPGAAAGSHPGPARMADTPDGSIAYTASPAGATNSDMGLKLTPVQSPAYSTRSGAANRSALRRERQVQDQDHDHDQDHDQGEGGQAPAGRSPAAAPAASGARSEAGPTAGSSLLEPGNKKGAQQGRTSEGGGGLPRRDVHTKPPVKAPSGRLHLASTSPPDAASAGDLGADDEGSEDVAAPSSLQSASEAAAGGTGGESPGMPPSGPGSVASTSVAGGGSEAGAARGQGGAASKQPVVKPEPMASDSKPGEAEVGMSGAAKAGIALSVVAVAALAGAAALVVAHKKDGKGRDRSWGEAASAARQAVAKFFGH